MRKPAAIWNNPDFWSNIVYDAGCWLWRGVTYLGYGRFKSRLAHRVAYAECEKETALSLDHKCRNTLCVNPLHLEPVTHRENCRRGVNGKYQTKRTHCPKGHPYDYENTLVYRGTRACRTCRGCRPTSLAAMLKPRN